MIYVVDTRVTASVEPLRVRFSELTPIELITFAKERERDAGEMIVSPRKTDTQRNMKIIRKEEKI